MLASGLYERDPHFRFDIALLCFFTLFSCGLGYLLVAFHTITDANNDPQAESGLV